MKFWRPTLCSLCAKKTSHLVDCSIHNAKECLRCNRPCYVKLTHQVHQSIKQAGQITKVRSSMYYFEPKEKVFYTSISRNNDPKPYVSSKNERFSSDDALYMIENDLYKNFDYDPRKEYDNNANIILTNFRKFLETIPTYPNFDNDMIAVESLIDQLTPENFKEDYENADEIYDHARAVLTLYARIAISYEKQKTEDVISVVN